MIDVQKFDEAITDALKDANLNGGRYTLVVWGPGGNMAYVTSNVPCNQTIQMMLEGAIDVIKGPSISEPVGSA
jgi:hypothetical protein